MRRMGGRVLPVFFLMMLCAGIARADQWTTPQTPWLLGDWGGLRTRLFQQGFDFQFGYVNEFGTNTEGGVKRFAGYSDQDTIGTTFDLERLLGIRDAIFQVTFTERTGRNLVADAQLNTLQLVQEVWGRGQTARLTQFWYDQQYFNGFVDWKAGRMPFGADFAAFSCNYQNLTFCGADVGNLVGNYVFNWPISQWATRVKFNLSKYWYLQVGAYDQNQQYLGYTEALLPVFYSGSSGVMYPVELAWLPVFGNGKLPGSYKFGGWYSTGTANDVVLDVNGNFAKLTGLSPMPDRGLYGAYINFQQQVTHPDTSNPASGLNLFLNAVMADRRTAFTDRQIAVGGIYTGAISWRPYDDIGFAAGTTHVNSRVASVENLINDLGMGPVGVQHSEYVMEVYYSWVPALGAILRPNIQYVITPGGTSFNKNALVFGLKTLAAF